MAKAGTGKEAVRKTWRGSEEEKGEFLMKKHNMMRAASALAVVTLLSTGLISGTLAKYTSAGSGTAETARVAKWSFGVRADGTNSGTTDLAAKQNFTFDLFKTVKDSDGTSDEGDVKNSTTDGKTVIAPGTSGSVDLYLSNDSEVTTGYKVEFVAENPDNVPLKYAITSANTSFASLTWVDSVASLNQDKTTKDNALAAGGNIIYHVYWKWDFENASVTDKDASDTDLGKSGSANPKITATVTATQVD